MKEEISPEERLLRLIRGRDRKPLKPTQEKEEVPTSDFEQINKKVDKKEEKIVGTLKKNRFSFISKGRWIRRYSSLNSIKNILLSIFLLLFFYLLINFVFIGPYIWSPKRILRIIEPNSKVGAPLSEEIVKKPIFTPKPYSYYTEEIGKRNLFSPIVIETEEKKEPEKRIVTLKELTSTLNLIGIIWDEMPEAIIEDTKMNKTYYLNRGEYIGEIKVEEIFEGKVTLTYKDEQLDLVL